MLLGGGKLSRPALMAQCAGAPATAAPLLFVRDVTTNQHFLVDTCAQVSVLPRRYLRHSTKLDPAPPGQQLVAANGSPIRVYGTHQLAIKLSSRHQFSHRFYITDITTPILGTDFLGTHRLVVDVTNQRLIQDGTICASTRPSSLSSTGVRLIREQAAARYAAVLSPLPGRDVTSTRPGTGASQRDAPHHHQRTAGVPATETPAT